MSKKVKRLYAQFSPEHYEIDFEIPEDDFRRLPKEGPYVTISNHPLGAIDGILLFKLMIKVCVSSISSTTSL